MTVESTLRKVTYEGNGVARSFPVPFEFSQATDLSLVFTNAAGVDTAVTSNFQVVTVSGGTSVTYPVSGLPMASGTRLTIFRETPQTQIVALKKGGAFAPDVLEHDGFDRIVMMVQELQEEISRSIRGSISGSMTPEELISLVIETAESVANYWELIKNALNQIVGVSSDSLVVATGATEMRTIGERFSDVVNVKDFGAQGNALADDTEAFVAALEKKTPIFVPAGEYRVSSDAGIDLSLLRGDGTAVLHFDTGSYLALENAANVEKLSQVFWKEVQAGTDSIGSNAVMQAIGVCEDMLFMSQNINADAGSWAYSSVVRLSKFPLARADSDEWNVVESGGESPIETADLLGLGHGTGCSVIIENGQQYVYSSVSVPQGETPIEGPSINYGNGFTKIAWKGSKTTQADIKSFRGLPGVYGAEVCVSQDGKYLVFYGYKYFRTLLSGETYSTTPVITVFDRKEVEAAASPSDVNPLHQFAVPYSTENNLGFATGTCSGICSDGRYIFAVHSGAQNVGMRSLLVFSLSGELIKATALSGMVALAETEFRTGKGGKQCFSYEIEGLALYQDALIAATKLNFCTPVDIVTWEGKNFLCTADVQGISPRSVSAWARTEAPATSGAYSSTKNYTAFTDPVYHKYITALVPAGIYDREHPVSAGLYPDSPSLYLSGLTAGLALYTHLRNSVYDRQSEKFFPLFEVMSSGLGRIYDTDELVSNTDVDFTSFFSRLFYDYSTGLTLSGGPSTATAATLALNNSRASSGDRYAIIWAQGDRRLLLGINNISYVNFIPSADNTLALGTGSSRWSQVYAASGSVNTSDKKEKTDIAPIPDAVLDAWRDVELCQFRWIDSVKEKGEGARVHAGVLAQDVGEVFKSKGIDPERYGFYCFDRWEERTESIDVTDENGAFVLREDGTPEQENVVIPAGERYGVRYEELLVLEAAYQRRRADNFEMRLAALEQFLS